MQEVFLVAASDEIEHHLYYFPVLMHQKMGTFICILDFIVDNIRRLISITCILRGTIAISLFALRNYIIVCSLPKQIKDNFKVIVSAIRLVVVTGDITC